MSRIGRLPITIPEGVEVKMDNNNGMIEVKGSIGSLKRSIHPKISIEIIEGKILVKRSSDSKEAKSLHGLTRSLINNMVIGVTEGFKKGLIIEGVGYGTMLKDKTLTLQIGYSHPIIYTAPRDIDFEVNRKNEIIVKGINKEQVGQVAAEIRGLKRPEPYKGKGIRYANERIRRKAGKSVVGTGTGTGG
ncbi:MAG: 50S ribosomal protein L6 [Nitrospinae bacterium]|nr:50S ribosomal protein L6 [Nitrospinota bacterium]